MLILVELNEALLLSHNTTYIYHIKKDMIAKTLQTIIFSGTPCMAINQKERHTIEGICHPHPSQINSPVAAAEIHSH